MTTVPGVADATVPDEWPRPLIVTVPLANVIDGDVDDDDDDDNIVATFVSAIVVVVIGDGAFDGEPTSSIPVCGILFDP